MWQRWRGSPAHHHSINWNEIQNHPTDGVGVNRPVRRLEGRREAGPEAAGAGRGGRSHYQIEIANWMIELNRGNGCNDSLAANGGRGCNQRHVAEMVVAGGWLEGGWRVELNGRNRKRAGGSESTPNE